MQRLTSTDITGPRTTLGFRDIAKHGPTVRGPAVVVYTWVWQMALFAPALVLFQRRDL